MFSAVTSVVLIGVEPRPVRVEVHVGGGRPSFGLVGLPDTAVREAKERVAAALRTSGYRLPGGRITVNLSPADLPKAGSAYDLPIALGILAASREIDVAGFDVVALGELALDGKLRATRGGLGAALVARDLGLRCVLAHENAYEASLVEGVRLEPAHSLAEAVAAALGETTGRIPSWPAPADSAPGPDVGDVRGQAVARRALEVAAAGGHHLLMSGPPGSGKTMLAKRLPGVLPELDREQALEVAQVWSAAGRRRDEYCRPPFRAPHHSATLAALVGGGTGVVVPGELTLAHRGVLFLDELGEFPPRLLEALRQPIEDGSILVSRKGTSVRFPAGVQIVAATNPCPCGYRGDRMQGCQCTEGALARYRRRLSGPLADRFDLRVRVERVATRDLSGPRGEGSEDVRRRVVAARVRQSARGRLNRELTRDELDGEPLAAAGLRLLEKAVTTLSLTARGWDRVRRVARTIADLAGSDEITESHVAEALAYRGAV